MILPEKTVMNRINSPDNLLQRLKSFPKKDKGMGLFVPSNGFNPFTSEESKKEESKEAAPATTLSTNEKAPTLDKLIDKPENIIKLELAHNNALTLLNRSVQALTDKLDDVKADKLPGVISAASKVVENIRKEKAESNKNKDSRTVNINFYTPTQRPIEEYQVIDVG